MRKYVSIFKALGDEKRLKILLLLRVRSLCVCELSELLRAPFSTLSGHLKILKNAGLVDNLKEGRWVVYRLAESQPIVHHLLDSLDGQLLKKDDEYKRDHSTVTEVTRELCAARLRKK